MVIPKSWGEYPPEYNRAVHGPYDPSRYYGKPDTPFFKVKLGELLPWLSRRNKSPRAMIQAMSRTWWSYHLKWIEVRHPGFIGVYQIITSWALLWAFIDYEAIKKERRYRYH